MHNNVVISLQRYFVSKGYLTVCINFRGCGNSKGRTSWTGMPEREDYYGVIDFITKDNNERMKGYPKVSSVILCGYSFGGMIASSIEPTSDIDYAYLLVSLPLGVYWALATTKASFFKKQSFNSSAPVFCIYGDSDQFTGVNTYEKWLEEKQSIKAIKMEGVDHFWMNFEQSLVEQVDCWRNQYWK
ncbi:hypothetical protein K501DRAFT_287515 [Backusella circina FSU 941]|nr:hypothetical protein K501DRAFT_287515 [Backusella circina FSU 941]